MIPEGWKETNIAAVIDGSIKNGYSPNPVENVTGFYVLSLGALGEDKSNFTEYKNIVEEPHIHEFILKYGDFLISRSNTPDKVGRAGLYLGEDSNIIYPDLMMRFRVNEDLIDKIFFIYYLKFSKTRTYFQQHAAGSSKSMVKINKNTVLSTPILLPPLAEQKKISEILSTWDEAISVVDKQLENCRLQKKALMQQLLTGKKRLPGFSGEWRSCLLGELGKFYKGEGIAKDEIQSEGFPCVRYGEIYTRHFDYIRKFYSFISNDVALKSFPLQKGDILFTCSGETSEEIGKTVAYVGDEIAYAGGDIIILRPEKEDSVFLGYYLNSDEIVSQKISFSQGKSVVHISAKSLQKIKCHLPSKEEQRALAEIFMTADTQIYQLEQKKLALTTEKQALMQQLLTGKKRVAV